MLDSEVLLPIVGDGLVELGVFVFCDLVCWAEPKWLVLVDKFPLVFDDCDFLLLLFFVLLLGFVFDFLDLVVLLLLVFLLLGFVIGDFLFLCLLNPKRNWVLDELGVLLDELLELLLFKEFCHVFLEVKINTCTTDEVFTFEITADCEVLASFGFPDVLVIVGVV